MWAYIFSSKFLAFNCSKQYDYKWMSDLSVKLIIPVSTWLRESPIDVIGVIFFLPIFDTSPIYIVGIPRNRWIKTFVSWPRHRSEIKRPEGVIALASSITRRSITGNAVTIVRDRVTIRSCSLMHTYIHARKDLSRVCARADARTIWGGKTVSPSM